MPSSKIGSLGSGTMFILGLFSSDKAQYGIVLEFKKHGTAFAQEIDDIRLSAYWPEIDNNVLQPLVCRCFALVNIKII